MSFIIPFTKNGKNGSIVCGSDVGLVLHALLKNDKLKLKDAMKLLKQRQLTLMERYLLEKYGYKTISAIAESKSSVDFRLVLHQLNEFRFEIWVYEHKICASEFTYLTEPRLNEVMKCIGQKQSAKSLTFSDEQKSFIAWAMQYHIYLSAWQFFRIELGDNQHFTAVH